MLFPTVSVQFVVAVESLPAEAALWMTFEAGLIYGPGVVITKSFMLPKFAKCEQLVFMGEDFLISCAQITHYLPMFRLDMTMQIWPPEASHIAFLVWTVVTEEKYCVFKNHVLLIFDAQIVLNLDEILILEIFVPSFGVVCENDKRRFGLLTVSALPT